MTSLVEPRPGGGQGWRLRTIVAAGLVAAIAAGAYLAVRPAHAHAGKAAPAAAPAAAAAALAPGGEFTTLSGAPATIASLRGKPAMVWFVAGGCASCAASIPAVAARLRQLTADGLRVVTLGLYGDFAAGKPGLAQLAGFGRAAADGPIARPGWLWGMASRSLSMAYDSSGTPDVYVLINAAGRIAYSSSVPVSTMPQLLSAAGHLTGHA
jgi:hypothetical protein